MMMKKIIVIMVLMSSLLSYGQTAEMLTDFKKMYLHYQSLQNYKMEFSVKLIDTENKIMSNQKGKVLHSKKMHFVDYGGNITLIRKLEFVSLNTYNRVMVYNKSKKSNQQESAMTTDISSILDSLYANQSTQSYQYISSKKGQKQVYIQDAKNEIYDGYALTYDAKTCQLLSLKYFIKPKQNQSVQEVEIQYRNEISNPKLNLNEYKINHYVKGNPGNLSPSNTFNNYKLIDQTLNTLNYE